MQQSFSRQLEVLKLLHPPHGLRHPPLLVGVHHQPAVGPGLAAEDPEPPPVVGQVHADLYGGGGGGKEGKSLKPRKTVPVQYVPEKEKERKTLKTYYTPF